MFAAARRTFVVYTVFILALSAGAVSEATETSSLVSREPSITFVGGTEARRETVVVGVNRYIESGLSLPDLEVHIHEDRSGCRDMQGLFRPSGGIALIDLCYGGEFLALHELGHAWEYFNLDADDREHFKQVTGATTWRSTDVVWRRRGAELTANTLARGLLSTHLESAALHALDFERFETLTGIPSPRLAELEPQAHTAPVTSATERTRLAAYETWRANLTEPVHGQGRREYEAGHIPGAVFVDLHTDLASQGSGGARHPLPTVEEFTALLGRLGIDTCRCRNWSLTSRGSARA
jgi:hypothetical protein